jgi:hypothetical protein
MFASQTSTSWDLEEARTPRRAPVNHKKPGFRSGTN